MIKNIFKDEPVDIIDIVDNERFLYYELIALKKEVKKNRKEFEKEKSKYNQVFGMTAKIEKDYIPITRLDIMTEKVKKEGYASVDIIEKEKIKYALEILYQLRFKLSGE